MGLTPTVGAPKIRVGVPYGRRTDRGGLCMTHPRNRRSRSRRATFEPTTALSRAEFGLLVVSAVMYLLAVAIIYSLA